MLFKVALVRTITHRSTNQALRCSRVHRLLWILCAAPNLCSSQVESTATLGAACQTRLLFLGLTEMFRPSICKGRSTGSLSGDRSVRCISFLLLVHSNEVCAIYGELRVGVLFRLASKHLLRLSSNERLLLLLSKYSSYLITLHFGIVEAGLVAMKNKLIAGWTGVS